MINERIEDLVERMTTVRKLENARDDKEKQKKAKAEFERALKRANGFSKAFKYASDYLGFAPSQELMSQFSEMLIKMRSVLQGGIIDIDKGREAISALNAVESQMRNEWKVYFKDYTPIIETLRAVRDIDQNRVYTCLSALNGAQDWKPEMLVLQRLERARTDYKNLIDGFSLDEKVISFLRKMADDKACISDLDHEIMLWIQKEGLENKIRLSFAT